MLTARTALLLTLLLTFSSLHHTTAQFRPIECCYGYAEKPIRHVQRYYRTPSDCRLPAVVIVAANGEEICADPEKPWVKKAIKKLQKKQLKPSTI